MVCVFWLGFSSGLPLLLIGSTFKAWMTELGVSLSMVGAFALVQLPYSLKFLWAPLLDRYQFPFLDRRRGWILVCQLGLAAALCALAGSSPSSHLAYSAFLCLTIAFLSATQDTAIDAYRREILLDEEQGLGASMGVNGYRIGLLVAGAGVLAIAQFLSWESAYITMGVLLVLSVVATLWAPSAPQQVPAPKNFQEAVSLPFKEFLKRPCAWEILIFILLFKLGDQMASDMFNPFYLRVGYEKVQIAAISKVFGLWATIVGGVLGGIALLRFPLFPCLMVFGILQALSTFGFSLLALLSGPNLLALACVVSFENLTGGLGTAAYVAFMASLTDRRFTATQYALLSSLMSVPRSVLGSTSGVFAQNLGWFAYFAFCALVAIPGLLLLLRSPKWTRSLA
jgi:PAT family beta-lactamase induction signal transducer AmpG